MKLKVLKEMNIGNKTIKPGSIITIYEKMDESIQDVLKGFIKINNIFYKKIRNYVIYLKSEQGKIFIYFDMHPRKKTYTNLSVEEYLKFDWSHELEVEIFTKKTNRNYDPKNVDDVKALETDLVTYLKSAEDGYLYSNRNFVHVSVKQFNM